MTVVGKVRRALGARPWLSITVLALSLVLLLEVAGVAWVSHYRHRALPGVSVAGVSVAGKSRAEIAAVAQSAMPRSVTISAAGTSVTASPTDLGLDVDTDATARAALVRRPGSFGIVGLIAARDAPIAPVIRLDEAKAQAFLDQSFAAVLKEPTNGAVHYDQKAGEFVATPALAGEHIPADTLVAALKGATGAGGLTVQASAAPAAATISTEAATKARAQASAMLAKPVPVVADGATIETFSRADIAALITFKASSDGALTPTVDREAIKERLGATSGRKASGTGQPEVRLVDSAGKVTHTIPGDGGHQISDADAASAAIAQAIESGSGKAVDVSGSVTSPKVKELKDGVHSARVHLKTQKVDFLVDDQVVHSYVVSTGKPATPTPKGTYTVYLKRPIQDLRGGKGADAYFHSSVKWLTYFNGGIGFHTAYWHNDFGTAVSHGCVNMREAQAKVAYDFLPIGSKVVVSD